MTEGNVELEQTNDLDEAVAILTPMIEGGASEDEMIIALIQSGTKYARAGRLLAKVLESKGLKVSAKDRYAAASENLTNWGFAPESWADVEDAVENLAQELDSTNEAQALSCVKRFAKEHEITLPEKPKGAGGGGSRGNIFDAFYKWASDNREASNDDIGAFIAGFNVPEKQAKKYFGRFTGIMAFARAFAQA